MPIMLGIIARAGKRSNIPYIGVYFIAISNNRHYIYAAKPSWILVPSYYIRVYI